jgi:hypothetical protein
MDFDFPACRDLRTCPWLRHWPESASCSAVGEVEERLAYHPALLQRRVSVLDVVKRPVEQQKSFLECFQSRDVEELMELYEEDVVFLGQSGKVATGKAAVRQARRPR